ncbi:MAG: hydrolase [Micrococcales bacterium]|nr:MAG: hydrolase [Micrococcales bacterium]
MLPGVVDRHVHLGLIDRGRLVGTPVVEVHDLGWDPAVIRQWEDDTTGTVIRFAGPFHTAVGGYPHGRTWMPSTGVRQLSSSSDAPGAVAAVGAAGGSFVKIALHTGMPLLPDPVLYALVQAAHEEGLLAYVHAEGPGQAERAIAAGADALAHVPWTEVLPDDVVAAAAVAAMTWISTLSIHPPGGNDAERALQNARRFVRAGGRLVYGTDMGNGPTPVGVNEREILLLGRVGLSGAALLRAVLADHAAPRFTAPFPLPETAGDLVTWLAAARPLG